MKKIFIIMSLAFLLMGCGKGENAKEHIEYNGNDLKIAIVGNDVLSNFKNISYQKRELDSLINDKEIYDALIITKDAFSEADQEKYIEFYNKVKYPVFFFGTEGFRDYAFLNKNMTIDMAKSNNAGYVQGFINVDGQRTKWELNLPDNPSSTDKNRKMLIRIFKLIESTQKDTEK
ncbi:hypothetical protein [Neobacillus sp.]|uniref:hypothetical protein n=1 Tax=Neobacillus sp. TaxID=2675273 RepID=UPI0028A03479|nr:hypothetical protein [Neobacillus sp.]